MYIYDIIQRQTPNNFDTGILFLLRCRKCEQFEVLPHKLVSTVGYCGSELPLASILRSLGLPATTFRGSLGSFKGSSLIWNSGCAGIFCFAYDAFCPFYNSVLGSFMSDNVTSSCTLSGMLAHYGSNRFIQRPILVVLHVSKLSITLVGGSPANSVDVL